MRGGMTTESGSAYSLKTTGVGATRAMEPLFASHLGR